MRLLARLVVRCLSKERARERLADRQDILLGDGLSRTTTDVLALVARAEREGWRIHCLQDAIDANSADGEFLLTLRAGLSQLERRKIGERILKPRDVARSRCLCFE